MPSPLNYDPTRTTTLRKKFERELLKRFNQLKREITQLIVEEDAFGIGTKNLLNTRWEVVGGGIPVQIYNNRWAGMADSEKVKAFRKWLSERVDALLLPTDELSELTESYWRQFTREAYGKGLSRAFDTIKRRGSKIAESAAIKFQAAKNQFLELAFGGPVAQRKLDILSDRVFSDLKGVTDAMSTNISRELVDGLTKGESPLTVGRNINKQVDKIGKQRATTIARTETIRAHAEGNLDAMEELGISKVSVAVEWSTAGDDRVCPLCEPLNGVEMSISEARGILPRHPNCRCAWIPAEDIGSKRNVSKIRSAIVKSVSAERPKRQKRTIDEQRQRSKWAGAQRIKRKSK